MANRLWMEETEQSSHRAPDVTRTAARPSDLALYYDGESDGQHPDLPAIDEIHYAFLEVEDEYSLVGYRSGRAIFTGLLPAGKLETVVGPVLANAIALGQGAVVSDEFWEGDEHPFRSLPLHEKHLNDLDQDWLKSMGIAVSR